MIRKLFVLILLTVCFFGLWWWISIHQKTSTVTPPITGDARALSLALEQSVQKTLQELSLSPAVQQSRVEKRDGKEWLLFYKKVRLARFQHTALTLSSLEQTWKNVHYPGDFKVWKVEAGELEKPKGKTLDVELGTSAFVTHHLVFIQPLNVQVAIIIDDVGFAVDKINQRILNLPGTLNLAVIPGTPRGQQMAEKAYVKGDVVMLHLPMEPLAYPKEDPGPWAIFVGQSDEQITEKVEKALAWVPHASGVNNHMGSRATADSRVMRDVLLVLQKHEVFFVDSMTSPKSVGHTLAAELKIPHAERNVFLDNTATEAFTLARINDLVNAARKNGYAIAIGHPHPSTVAALEKSLPDLQKQGIDIVGVKELLH